MLILLTRYSKSELRILLNISNPFDMHAMLELENLIFEKLNLLSPAMPSFDNCSTPPLLARSLPVQLI